MAKIREILAINVRKYRKARGLTQTQLAEKMGVTLQTVFKYETGHGGFTADALERLAEALGVEETDLVYTASSQPKATVLDAIEIVHSALGELAAGADLKTVFGPDLPKLRRIAERRNRRKKTDPDKD